MGTSRNGKCQAMGDDQMTAAVCRINLLLLLLLRYASTCLRKQLQEHYVMRLSLLASSTSTRAGASSRGCWIHQLRVQPCSQSRVSIPHYLQMPTLLPLKQYTSLPPSPHTSYLAVNGVLDIPPPVGIHHLHPGGHIGKQDLVRAGFFPARQLQFVASPEASTLGILFFPPVRCRLHPFRLRCHRQSQLVGQGPAHNGPTLTPLTTFVPSFMASSGTFSCVVRPSAWMEDTTCLRFRRLARSSVSNSSNSIWPNARAAFRYLLMFS